MGLLDRKKSVEGLEAQLERGEVENQVLSQEAEIVEKKAVIHRLKKEYGHDWRKILGVSGSDLSTLKSFLTSAKSGLTKAGMGGKSVSPGLNPLPPGMIKRA